MKITTTKFFSFSASHQVGEKLFGYNYSLGVTTEPMDEESEKSFERRIHEALIQKLESKDLGLHVEFLRGARITDDNLLRIFWGILKKTIHPMPLLALSLEKDSRTKVVMADETV